MDKSGWRKNGVHWQEKRVARWPLLGDKEWLRDRHEVKEEALSAMAREVGCFTTTLIAAMKYHGLNPIPNKTKGKSIAATWRQRRLEKWPQLFDKTYMSQEYTEKGFSVATIAKNLGCSEELVSRALSEHEIPAHGSHTKQALSLLSGPNHYKWKGGIYNGKKAGPTGGSHLRHKLQKQVKKERGDCCERCFKHPPEVYRIEMHHIVPERFSHDNERENLILLCPKCHAEAEQMFLWLAGKFFMLGGCPGLREAVTTWMSEVSTATKPKDS